MFQHCIFIYKVKIPNNASILRSIFKQICTQFFFEISAPYISKSFENKFFRTPNKIIRTPNRIIFTYKCFQFLLTFKNNHVKIYILSMIFIGNLTLRTMGFEDFNTFSYLKSYKLLFRKIAFLYVAK